MDEKTALIGNRAWYGTIRPFGNTYISPRNNQISAIGACGFLQERW